MKYWQKQRNYRKQSNGDGLISYFITVDGIDVEVNQEVFFAYSKADRRERYLKEREVGRILSLERLSDDDMKLAFLTDEQIESAEDTALTKMSIEQMLLAIEHLEANELQIIKQLFFEDLSLRKLTKTNGIPVMTLHARKQRIIEKIMKLMETQK